MDGIPQAQLIELAEYLAGSANTLDAALTVFEIPMHLQDAVGIQLADHVFLCEKCGWWDSIDDLQNNSGEELCPDCADD